MRTIVTGAAGFIGANLTRRLLAEGHEVFLLLRPGYVTWRLKEIFKDVRVYEVDLTERESVATVVKDIRPEWIFHLAAHGAYSYQNDLHRIVQTNLIGTINLVDACLRVGFEAFVNTGSSSEYGFKDHAPAETEWLEPSSYYAVTKASATLFCRYTAQHRKLHIPTLRLYSVFGPWEEPTRLIPTLIMNGLRGELPPLVNPDIARDFVFTDDVCDAYLAAASKRGQEPGAVYNVGTGVQTSIRQVVDLALRTMNINVEPQWGSMPDRHWDTSVWIADNRKIAEALDWKPRFTFEEGFLASVKWFRMHEQIYRTQS